MHISPISAYRSNPQVFTGNERPGIGAYIRKAVMIPTIGVATLVGAPIAAQTTSSAGTAKAETTAVADSKTLAKPYVFAKEVFNIGYGNKLALYVVNLDGKKDGFNAIMGQLFDADTEETTKGVIAALIEPAEDSHLAKWFVFLDLKEYEIIAEVTDKKAVNWVESFLNDVNLNKSDIVIKKVVKEVSKLK
jgi:hypothetical protein